MSALSDIMAGLRTVIDLTGRVETLTGNVNRLTADLRDVDRRLIRVETIIEVTRSDGATLRIARDPEDQP